MSCQEDRLNEYLDTTLDRAASAEVERHLEGCDECRRVVDGLRRVKEGAAALPRSAEPPRDLWPEIRDSLPGQVASFERRLPGHWLRPLMALAAVFLLGMVTVLLLQDQGADVATGPRISGVALNAVEEEYRTATDELLEALDVRREDLSPDTLRVVDENLRIIDEAIGRLRTAIEADPDRAGSGHRMIALYGRKVDLLQQAVHLPTEAWEES